MAAESEPDLLGFGAFRFGGGGLEPCPHRVGDSHHDRLVQISGLHEHGYYTVIPKRQPPINDKDPRPKAGAYRISYVLGTSVGHGLDEFGFVGPRADSGVCFYLRPVTACVLGRVEQRPAALMGGVPFRGVRPPFGRFPQAGVLGGRQSSSSLG